MYLRILAFVVFYVESYAINPKTQAHGRIETHHTWYSNESSDSCASFAPTASTGPIKMMTDEVYMMNEVMIIFVWKKNQKRNNLFCGLQNVC